MDACSKVYNCGRLPQRAEPDANYLTTVSTGSAKNGFRSAINMRKGVADWDLASCGFSPGCRQLEPVKTLSARFSRHWERHGDG